MIAVRRASLSPLLVAGCLLEFDPVLLEQAPKSTIASGAQHTCAIADDDRLYCWGGNAFGALGVPEPGESTAPIRVGDERWRHVATAGNYANFSCGAQHDGSLWCWGADGDAMLGQGELGDASKMPAAVALDGDVVMVGAGSTAGIALADDGVLWTWGWNNAALGLADETLPYLYAPAPLVPDGGEPWSFVDYGRIHGCGIRGDNKTLWCWGDPETVALGRDDGERTPAPIASEADGWRMVAAGDSGEDSSHTCGIKQDGTLWCWGTNVDGRLGIAGVDSTIAPLRVGDASDWHTVGGGERHTCGIRDPGTLWCWGADDYGQLGDGGETSRATPFQIGDREDWIDLSVGAAHNCGRTEDGTLWCWGSNSNGQTGQPQFGVTARPSDVAFP